MFLIFLILTVMGMLIILIVRKNQALTSGMADPNISLSFSSRNYTLTSYPIGCISFFVFTYFYCCRNLDFAIVYV